MAPLGKKDLLAWAASTTGIYPCNKYADLRDGVVMLALAARLFPADVDPRLLRRGPTNADQNWAALRRVMQQYGLPLHLYDHNALAAGHARHCFNMLVLFYFLTRLASDSDFCIDFANPIDPGVAEFLQSPQSLRCIGKLPATRTTVTKGMNKEKSGHLKALVQPSLPPQPPPPPQQQPPQQQQPQEPLLSSQQVLSSSLDDAVPSAVPASSSSILLRATSAASLSDTSGGVVDYAEGASSGVDDALARKLRIMRGRNARLEEELQHVRATSQLMLAQQRALVTSEVARMTEQFEVQMALLRLERDHEMRRCLLDVREEYDNFIGNITGEASSSLSSPQPSFTAFMALEGKVHAYERELTEARDTIQGLRNALHVQRDRHEAFAEKISSICAAAPIDGPEASDFIKAIAPLLETQPHAVRDAVVLQLKTLLAQMVNLKKQTESPLGDATSDGKSAEEQVGGDMQNLRMQLERLKRANNFLRNQRCQQEKVQQHHDWYAVPLADGLEAPSCMIDFETCEAICERASAVAEAHTAAGSSARWDLQRLIFVVSILRERVKIAAKALIAYQGKQQSLYEQLLSVRQGELPDVHERQRALEAKWEEQNLQIEKREAVLTTRMRLLEERCSRREAVANMLHERIRDMMGTLLGATAAAGNNGGVTLEEAQAALRQLMEEVENSQCMRDSMDAALRELSEEVAFLRQNVARRDRDVERLRTALDVAEASLREERAKSTGTAGELRALHDVMAIEIDGFSRYIERVGELLIMEGVKPPSLPRSNFLTKTEAVSGNADSSTAIKLFASSDNNTSDHSNKDIHRNENTSCVTTAPPLSSFSVPAVETNKEATSSLLSSDELERRKVEILESKMSSTLFRTPLHGLHVARKAQMGSFAGYSMPIYYPKGIAREHLHTRQAASVFDLSYFGIFEIRGADRHKFFEWVTPSNVAEQQTGKCALTLFLNESAGVKDDCIVSKYSDHLLCVANAGCKEKIRAYLHERLAEFKGDATLVDLDRAMLSLQGPKSADVLSNFVEDLDKLSFMHCRSDVRIKDISVTLARCSYSGEDGFDIITSPGDALSVVELLLQNSDVELAGLGARDTLRTEAGLCLYSHELSETINPVAARLMWCIPKRRIAEGNFIGCERLRVLVKNAKELVPRLRMGILSVAKGSVPRAGTLIIADGQVVGEVSSGVPSPTLSRNIAMGYVDRAVAEVGRKVELEVSGRRVPGEITMPRFVPLRYYKG